MSVSETHRRRWLPVLVFGLLAMPAFASSPALVDDDVLAPEARHEDIGLLVSRFIQKSHYLHITVDDDLSSRVMDRYIEAIDRQRMYLLASDIDFFERYRHELDDIVKNEPLDPVFDMFSVYRTRVRERFQYALTQLDSEPNLTIDEDYQFDRSEAPWATSREELDEIWRRRVKNDIVNLALTDKSWEETREILVKRYQRYLKRMRQVKNDDVFETFMNAFAHTLDPHSSYLSPRNSEEYRIQMSLSYFGIGASLQTEDDYVQIISIIPGGPASVDGKLKPNDRIIGVAQGPDGKMVDVIGWRLDDVVDLIRGPADTVVRLNIIPAGGLPESQKELSIVRGQVRLEEQAAKSDVISVPRDGREWRIGIIEVPSFYRDYRALSNGDKDYTSTTKDVKRLIAELEEQGIDGLIIDLRDNGGGHLTEATALSGLFIDNGPVVQLRNSARRVSRLDDPDPVKRVAYNGPLAVLVNRFSASASEIFAAAIQDYERGVIIGQNTFGKGTVQNLYSLDQYINKPEDDPGYGQLTLTIGKYYRVTGESTQHRGVLPDIDLPSPIDAAEIGESVRDSALPWDTIETTPFRAGAPLDATIQSLSAAQYERAKVDPNYRYLTRYIEDNQDARSRTTVSLNIETRRAEREQNMARALELENERRLALSLEPIDSLEEIGDEDRPDVQLDQAAGIVTDLAQLRELDGPPTPTAQVGR